jgi:hypothetical protein
MDSSYISDREIFKLHSIIYFDVKECYIYSCVVSVDHFPCGIMKANLKNDGRIENKILLRLHTPYITVSFQIKIKSAKQFSFFLKRDTQNPHLIVF